MSVTQTPAEQLAAKKRPKLGKTTGRRKAAWNCGLRRLRQELKLTIDDVAEAVGMSAGGLHDLEHGGDPRLTTAFALCEFFGKKADEIWTTPDATGGAK